MALKIKHATQVTGTDDPTKQVNAPQWNADHEIVGLADNELPAGDITGTNGADGNATFMLSNAPDPPSSLQLFKTDVGTAVLLLNGVHYTLAGNTITYSAGNIPIAGMTHRAWYRF